jgi:hypothetical protein
MMSHMFSIAFMANTLSMTAMLIIFSLFGQGHLAADLGIVQASTTALFYAFSANARNIVLATSNPDIAKSIFNIRAILLGPLILSAFWLSASLGGVEPYLAVILILRRSVEWFGEVELSERERQGNNKFAISYILIQVLLFTFAASWLLLKMPIPLLGLLLWALLPLLLNVQFSVHALSDFATAISGINKKIAPHFGSTLAIGISFYVFRLLMIIILGKNVSGDLFAAFAIGGVLGSLTFSTFGPSIALKEKVRGKLELPKLLTYILYGFSGLGLLIIGVSYMVPGLLLGMGKEVFYWKAIGFSMIGGVIMTHAQLLRNRLLIHNENHDLFGPDLLMNILIIAAIPLAFFLVGIDAVAALSLLGAILSLVFYKSSEYAEISGQSKYKKFIKYLPAVAAMFVLMPVFVRLNSGIFLDKEILLSGGSSLMSLPIPISIILVYVAILAVGSYRQVHGSLAVIFFTFILMMFSTLLVSENHGDSERTKILLIIQYILPMGALVLGAMFNAKTISADLQIERAFLLVLVFVVPLQLVSSWAQGSHQLVGYLYIISIYQHVHYVPIVIVAAFLLILFSLWPNNSYRKSILILSPMMGIYVAASLSIFAIVFLTAGVLVFALSRRLRTVEASPVVISVLVLTGCLGYLSAGMPLSSLLNKFRGDIWGVVNAWHPYAMEVIENISSLLLGHERVLDKVQFPSSHNYYLDIIRNFGLVGLAPVFVLLGYTISETCSARKYLAGDFRLLGYSIVLFFLLIIENSTHVSLRQPYSGVFTFFIWGIYMAQLNKSKGNPVNY